MFSEEGNKALNEIADKIISKYSRQSNGTAGIEIKDHETIEQIVLLIQDTVFEMGKDKQYLNTHPEDKDDIYIIGFDEVYDSAVRDFIYELIILRKI
jgi:hypothetical protein